MTIGWIRVVLSVLLVGSVVVLTVSKLFDFHYPRAVDNEPLIAPYKVVSVQDGLLHLEDGRIIALQEGSGRLSELIMSSGNRVDLEMGQHVHTVDVFVKSRLAGCGDPFAMVRWLFPPYCIPLFPDDYPLNCRDHVGHGLFVTHPGNLGATRNAILSDPASNKGDEQAVPTEDAG